MSRTRTDPVASAQLDKLARTLHVPVDTIAYLADVPDADLRTFRIQVADMLHASQSKGLRPVAAAARIVPTPIAVKLMKRNGNPLFAARLAGVLEPSHAADVAKRLPAEFLADVATHLDSRRASVIVGGLPSAMVVEVATLLAARADWITLGDLVGAVSDEAAAATVAALDAMALLHSAYMVDDAEGLARFTALTSEAKRAEMLSAAAEHDLWAEFRPTVADLSADAVAALETAAATLPPAQRDRALAELRR